MKIFAIFTILLFFTLPIFAEESIESPSTETIDPQTEQPFLRRKTNSKVRGLTDMIDDLFGTERRDENRRFSTLRLSGRHTIRDGLPSETSYNVRLMIRPATFQNWSEQANRWMKKKKKKVKNFVIRPKQNQATSVEPEDPVDPVDTYVSTYEDEDEGVSEDTSAQPKERDPWRFSFDQRIRFDRDNFFEGRAKATKDFEIGDFLHHVVADVRWSMRRQWESALSTVSSYSLSDCLLFQFGNSFNWLMTQQNFESTHGPSLAYTISNSKVISLSFTTAVGTSPWWVNAYTITSVYRQHIYEDWIDFSVTPYQSYTRLRNFQAETGIIFNAEVAF